MTAEPADAIWYALAIIGCVLALLGLASWLAYRAGYRGGRVRFGRRYYGDDKPWVDVAPADFAKLHGRIEAESCKQVMGELNNWVRMSKRERREWYMMTHPEFVGANRRSIRANWRAWHDNCTPWMPAWFWEPDETEPGGARDRCTTDVRSCRSDVNDMRYMRER